MKTRTILGIVLLTFVISSCKKAEEVLPKNAIQLGQHAQLGKILTDGEGFTLYFFSKDADGTSNCDGDCLENWPVFYDPDVTDHIPEGLEPSDFTNIVRGDGTKQTSYKGWPLYYFINDAKAGDVLGDGVKNIWWAANPEYSVMIANGNGQNYLTDGSGHALYSFDNDTNPDASVCTGGCLDKWPAFYVSPLVVPSGLNAQDFTTFQRGDNMQSQYSYSGKPMYYFAPDGMTREMRGETLGDGVNDVWHLFVPAGVQP